MTGISALRKTSVVFSGNLVNRSVERELYDPLIELTLDATIFGDY